MGLKDLPILPTLAGEEVREGYAAELKAVTSPTLLWEFTMRWRPLYLLTRKRRIGKQEKNAKRFKITQKHMQNLISGTWNREEAFACIQASREGVCKHAQQYSCVGVHILIPEILLQADFVAKQFGVGSDLALIQMHGGLGALES